MRQYYAEHQVPPDVRQVMKHIAEHCGHESRNKIFGLFPYVYSKASLQDCRHETAKGLEYRIGFSPQQRGFRIIPRLMELLMPESNYIASDADFVDYITELMGGFAIPSFVKRMHQNKRYLLLGLRLNRDTDRMVFSDIIFGADNPAGWALIPHPTDKEKRFLGRYNIEIVNADVADFLAATQTWKHEARYSAETV